MCSNEVLAAAEPYPRVYRWEEKDATATLNIETEVLNGGIFTVTPINTVNPTCSYLHFTAWTDAALTAAW